MFGKTELVVVVESPCKDWQAYSTSYSDLARARQTNVFTGENLSSKKP